MAEEQNLTPEQQADARQRAAADYAAQFDIEGGGDNPASEPQGEVGTPAAPSREPIPRNDDGTFRKRPHPAALLALASDLGIPQEDIEGLDTDALDNVVKHVARNALRIQREHAANLKLRADSFDHHLGLTPPSQNPPPESENDFLEGVDLAGFDPAIQAGLKKTSELERENKALKEQLGGIQKQLQEGTVASNAEMIDAGFAALGEKYAKLFGTGSAGAGDLKPEEYQRRCALLANSGLDFSKRQNARSVAAAIKKVADLLYAPVLSQQAEPYSEVTAPEQQSQQTDRRVEQWNQGGVARPTQRQSAELPHGTERAVRSVSRILEAQRQAQGGEQNGAAGADDFLQ